MGQSESREEEEYESPSNSVSQKLPLDVFFEEQEKHVRKNQETKHVNTMRDIIERLNRKDHRFDVQEFTKMMSDQYFSKNKIDNETFQNFKTALKIMKWDVQVSRKQVMMRDSKKTTSSSDKKGRRESLDTGTETALDEKVLFYDFHYDNGGDQNLYLDIIQKNGIQGKERVKEYHKSNVGLEISRSFVFE